MVVKHKISWEALRYSNTHDNKVLQIGIAFILGLMVIFSILFKNYFFGAFIVIAAILLFHIKKNEKPNIFIDIDHNGISINNELIPYNKLNSFYIDETSETIFLLIQYKQKVFNSIKIMIVENSIDLQGLRNLLSEHLKEKKLKQSSIDELMNAL